MRRCFLLTLAAVLCGCAAADSTKPPFGAELTAAEQVAVEAAFGRVADSLDKVGATADDSIMADFTRVAARLVRLQGRYGTISVQVPGQSARMEMRAIAVTSRDPASSANIVLAWDGLDVASFTLQRALVFQSGGLTSSLAPQMRFLDMTVEASRGFYSGGGTLTFSTERFTNNCTGLSNTATETCRAGEIVAAGQADVTRISDAVAADVDFGATSIAGFEVVVK